MELRVLKYFLMTAREENITRAAEKMHVTQPTLSRQLMQLEDELGVKLFKRSKHSITLTDEGMLLKQRAQEMVSIEDKIFQDLSYNNDMLTGIITIGSGETQSMNEISMLIASFRRYNPNVKFEICTGIADDIKEKIEKGIVDIGLLSEPVDISKYEFVRMTKKEQWGVIMPNDCPLAEKEYISPKDLSGVPLIMAKREGVRNEVANWFGKYYDNLEIVASCDLLYNIEVLVKNKVGIAICIKSSNQYDNLCFKPLFPKLETGAVLVWKKHRTVSPAVSRFIDYSKEYIKGIIQNTM